MARNYRPAEPPDIEFLQRTEQRAFLCSADAVDRYISQVGLENFRILLQDDTPVGALTLLPQSQWWQGQKIAMAGIASVSVLPEARRQGNAVALLQATLQELRDTDQLLSVLYSAADPLYRALGYGVGGTSGFWQVPTHRINCAGTRSAQLMPIRSMPLALEQLRPLQQRYAPYHNGHLDRHSSIWAAIMAQDKDRLATSAYSVGPPSAPEGYVVFSLEPGTPSTLHISDWAIATPEAGRSLWGFLAQMDTQIDTVRWRGGTIDPMVLLLPDSTASLKGLEYWRLRLVNVPGALMARGYPTTVAARLSLQVSDPILEENQGVWTLAVKGGRGTVTPGSEAQISLSVDHLASLYAGVVSPYQLRQLGQLEGHDNGLAIAAALFAGPSPWLPDFF